MKRSLVADFLQAKAKLSQKDITASQSMGDRQTTTQHNQLAKPRKQWELFFNLKSGTFTVEQVEIE